MDPIQTATGIVQIETLIHCRVIVAHLHLGDPAHIFWPTGSKVDTVSTHFLFIMKGIQKKKPKTRTKTNTKRLSSTKGNAFGRLMDTSNDTSLIYNISSKEVPPRIPKAATHKQSVKVIKICHTYTLTPYVLQGRTEQNKKLIQRLFVPTNTDLILTSLSEASLG